MQTLHVSAWALAELLNPAYVKNAFHEDTSCDPSRVSDLLSALSSHVVAFNHRVRDNCLSEVESTALLAKTSEACDALTRQQQQYAATQQK